MEIINSLLQLLLAIVLDAAAIFKGQPAILVALRDYQEYQDGKPTGRRGGTTYSVVVPPLRYMQIDVKVPDLPPVFDPKELAVANEQGPVLVEFTDFAAKFYRRSDSRNPSAPATLALSAKASAIRVLGVGEAKK